MCFKNNQKGFFSLLKGLQKEDLVHCREDFVFGGKCPLSNSQGGLTSYRHRVEAGKNIQRHQALMTRNSPWISVQRGKSQLKLYVAVGIMISAHASHTTSVLSQNFLRLCIYQYKSSTVYLWSLEMCICVPRHMHTLSEELGWMRCLEPGKAEEYFGVTSSDRLASIPSTQIHSLSLIIDSAKGSLWKKAASGFSLAKVWLM